MGTLNIKKPHELAAYSYLRAAIYGGPGVGKSSLAASGRKVLYIDCDKGVHRMNERHHVDTIEVERWEDITAILDGDISEYDTIAPDTMGKMLLFMNEYLIRMNSRNAQGDGSLTQKAYGVRKAMFVDFLNRISQLKKHLIFVCHDKEDKKGEGGALYIRPDVGGSSGNDLIRELDMVAYIFVSGGKRMMTCDPGENYYGKNTLGLPPFIELPDITKVPNTLMARIIGDFEKQAEGRQALKLKFKEMVDDVTDKANKCKTAEAINELYSAIDTGYEHIWDSAGSCKKAVVVRATEMGLIPNRLTRKFEKPPKNGAEAGEAGTASTPGSEVVTEPPAGPVIG